MQIKNTFLFALTLGFMSTRLLAAELVIENNTTHKIVQIVVSDPENASLQGIGFKIDEKKVLGFETFFILEMMNMLSPEDKAEAMADPSVALLTQGQPLFAKGENQKAVFSYNKDLCEEALACQVTSEGETRTFCFLRDAEIMNGTVWIFQELTE